MTVKLSRAALAAGIAIGSAGLVAVPADAALTAADNAVSTPNYYVKSPVIGAAKTVTPQSAAVSAVIDTGGDQESLLPVPSGGLTWDGATTITSGVAMYGYSAGNYVPVDGIPTNDSNSDVSVSVTDASVNSTSAVLSSVSNGGADNYSTVTFEYDPVSDYDSSDNQPGPNTQFSEGVDVSTTTGLSTVETTLGAFGQTAQNSSGNNPLKPDTKYYYWIVQQPGSTDSATDINVAKWADTSTNPTDVCLPNVAIAQDKTLASYTSTTTISADGTSAAAVEGPCVYYYGDTTGNLNIQSGVGEFTTAKIGKLTVARSAKVDGRKAKVAITDASAYKASGELELDNKAGDTLATGKFSLKAGKSGTITLKLTAAGVTAAKKGKSGAVSLTSNWDQKTATKSIKLSESK